MNGVGRDGSDLRADARAACRFPLWDDFQLLVGAGPHVAYVTTPAGTKLLQLSTQFRWEKETVDFKWDATGFVHALAENRSPRCLRRPLVWPHYPAPPYQEQESSGVKSQDCEPSHERSYDRLIFSSFSFRL